MRATDARRRARTDAVAISAGIELQLSQPIAAAETLGGLAKYNGGLATNFQQIAGELLVARPAVASLELQPSGVVGAIIPWAGNERAIGANVFRDPPRRLGANTAIQKRALTVAGPLRLLSGEPGISVMVPIFQRGRDGREAFWGFVAASMRVSEAVAKAQVNDLATKGYCYVLLAPAPAQQKSIALAEYGPVSLEDAIEQPIRVRNLEWRLALVPKGGWVNKAKRWLE